MQFFTRRLFLFRGIVDCFAFLLLDAEQFTDIVLQILLSGYGIAIEFLRRNMSGFRAIDTTLQSIFSHCCGIGVLILFQLDARHYVIGAQPRTSCGFHTIFPPTRLVGLLFSDFTTFAGYNGNDSCMNMRCRFIHVQYRRNDVFGSESLS